MTTDAGKKSLVKIIDLCPGPIYELFINLTLTLDKLIGENQEQPF